MKRPPLVQRTPLRQKRLTPRRDEGRVTHGRIKEREERPTLEQRRFWDSLPSICQACGALGAIIHHLMAPAPGKVRRRDHWFIVRLCPSDHNMGDDSVHLLGSEAKFLAVRGVDLVAIAVANLEQWRSQK